MPLIDKYTIPNNLSSKVAIVTGGSRGIGKGIAIELGRAGMTVYVASRSTRSGSISTERDLGSFEDCTVERTAEEINELGGKGIPIPLDGSNDDEIAQLVQKVQEELNLATTTTQKRRGDVGGRIAEGEKEEEGKAKETTAVAAASRKRRDEGEAERAKGGGENPFARGNKRAKKGGKKGKK